MRKNGIENFVFEEVYQEEVETEDKIREIEKNFIIQYDCLFPNGYNQTIETFSPPKDDNIKKKIRDTKRQRYGKAVCEIDSNDNIIDCWNSIAEAAEKTKLLRYKISAVCNGRRRTTSNRRFRFIEDGKIIEPIYHPKTFENRITSNSRKVVQLTKTLEFIQIFPSIAIAAKQAGCDDSSITANCKGKVKSAGGYIWKYLEDYQKEEDNE